MQALHQQIWRWLLICIFLFLVASSSSLASTTSQPVELSGKWEFYWQQLLVPKDFQSSSDRLSVVRKTKDYIKVPSSWAGQMLGKQTNNGQPLPRDGFATYRLLTTIAPNLIGNDASLSVRYVSSAYRIWIDGKEFGGMGKIGTSTSTEQVNARAATFEFQPQSTQVEIILQVSNFSYNVPGITEPTIIGPTQLVTNYDMRNYVIQDLVLIGLFLGLALFHFVLYFLRRGEMSLLWLGFVGLTATFRTLFINEHFVYPLIPGVSWEWILRIQYTSDVCLFLCVVLYTRSMFSQEMKNWYMQIFYGYALIVSGFILFSSSERISSNTLLLVTFIVFFIFLLIQTTVLAIFRKREGAGLNAFALTVLLFSIIHDTLHYAKIIDSVPIFRYTICLYLFFQAFLVARRYAFTMRQSQELSQNLALINSDLELQVKERTQERINFLTNVAHDIGSPLLSIQSSLMLLRDGSFPPEKQAELLELWSPNRATHARWCKICLIY